MTNECRIPANECELEANHLSFFRGPSFFADSMTLARAIRFFLNRGDTEAAESLQATLTEKLYPT